MSHNNWQIRDYLDYFFYNIVRRALLFGINIKPIAEALDLKPQESIIDIGCGWGEYAKTVPQDTVYTGIDTNPKALTFAGKKYNGKNKDFKVLDIAQFEKIDKCYDKALLFGVLHHLPQHIIKDHLVPFLKSNIKDIIVFCDPVYLKNQFSSNLLAKFDRGKFVLSYENERIILSEHFNVTSASVFSSNTKIAKYGLFVVKNG